MFERFTDAARGVVRGAHEEARALGDPCIGTEHLLLALLQPASGPAASILAEAGMSRARALAAIADLSGSRGLLGPGDADALQTIGIDLAAVVAAIEAAFGPEALRLPPAARRRRLPRLHPRRLFRRRRAGPPPATVQRQRGGHIPFTARSKKVLELSLRESIRLHSKSIGTEHILLGLLREGDGLAARILVDSGCPLDDLRRRTLRALADAA